MFYRVDPSIIGTGFLGDHQKFAPDDEIYDFQHEIEFPKNFAKLNEEDWSPIDMMNIVYGEIPFERIDLWKKFINYYYNCLRDVDRHINTLVENLKSSNQLENTIIGKMINAPDFLDFCNNFEEKNTIKNLQFNSHYLINYSKKKKKTDEKFSFHFDAFINTIIIPINIHNESLDNLSMSLKL